MRLLHTADWHLGRIFYGASLIEDQAIALDGFCAWRPISVPTRSSSRVTSTTGRSPRRKPLPSSTRHSPGWSPTSAFRWWSSRATTIVRPSGLRQSSSRARRVARRGPMHADPVSLAVATSAGPARIWALPHADPSEVACALDDECVRGHEAAMAAMLARVRAATGAGERHVVVAHAFVTGESERVRATSRAWGGRLRSARPCSSGFDYVALGHLHRPQSLGRFEDPLLGVSAQVLVRRA